MPATRNQHDDRDKSSQQQLQKARVMIPPKQKGKVNNNDLAGEDKQKSIPGTATKPPTSEGQPTTNLNIVAFNPEAIPHAKNHDIFTNLSLSRARNLFIMCRPILAMKWIQKAQKRERISNSKRDNPKLHIFTQNMLEPLVITCLDVSGLLALLPPAEGAREGVLPQPQQTPKLSTTCPDTERYLLAKNLIQKAQKHKHEDIKSFAVDRNQQSSATAEIAGWKQQGIQRNTQVVATSNVSKPDPPKSKLSPMASISPFRKADTETNRANVIPSPILNQARHKPSSDRVLTDLVGNTISTAREGRRVDDEGLMESFAERVELVCELFLSENFLNRIQSIISS